MRNHTRISLWTGLLAILTTNAMAQPKITVQPKHQSASLGAQVTFRVTASGTAPLSYQWQREGADLADATANPLVLTNVQLTTAGDYRVVVTDSTGSVTSQAATLGVDPTFTKITSGSIVTEKAQFTYCAWGDYNGDGFLDLFVTSRETANLLYRNHGDGTFSKVTNANLTWFSGANHTGGVWGDYDNDGFLDLLCVNGGLTGNGQNVLYHNNGDGTFHRLDAAALGSIATRKGSFIAATWGDYDADGFLDVFVPDLNGRNYLYRNLGGTQFAEATGPDGKPAALGTTGHVSAWADYDHDGDLDLLVGGFHTEMVLYRNDRQAGFTRGPLAYSFAGAESGGGWADFNNDGWFDLFLADEPRSFLYANQGDGTFRRLDNVAPVSEPTDTWGADWGDYDNDGWLDLFLANGLPGNPPLNNSLYRNQGDGTFEKIVTGSLVNDQARSGFCAWGDYDNDGCLDLFVANGWNSSESNFLYRNNGNANGWLKVRCVGTVSNRSAMGAKVRVSAVINGQARTQLRQIASSNGSLSGSLEAHLGLGDATTIELLRIDWPSGAVQEFHNVGVKQQLTITEPARLEPQGPGAFRIRCWKGQAFEVQASADLRQWSSLGTVTNETGTLEFTDPAGAAHSHRFYRAVSP